MSGENKQKNSIIQSHDYWTSRDTDLKKQVEALNFFYELVFLNIQHSLTAQELNEFTANLFDPNDLVTQGQIDSFLIQAEAAALNLLLIYLTEDQLKVIAQTRSIAEALVYLGQIAAEFNLSKKLERIENLH